MASIIPSKLVDNKWSQVPPPGHRLSPKVQVDPPWTGGFSLGIPTQLTSAVSTNLFTGISCSKQDLFGRERTQNLPTRAVLPKAVVLFIRVQVLVQRAPPHSLSSGRVEVRAQSVPPARSTVEIRPISDGPFSTQQARYEGSGGSGGRWFQRPPTWPNRERLKGRNTSKHVEAGCTGYLRVQVPT